MDRESAIERAVRVAGGQASLASKISISPQAVNKWVKRGKVPVERVLEVERATEGRVSRHELRPDIYPPEDSPALRSRHFDQRQQAL